MTDEEKGKRPGGGKALFVVAGFIGAGILLTVLRNSTESRDDRQLFAIDRSLKRAEKVQSAMNRAAREHPDASYARLKELTRDERREINRAWGFEDDWLDHEEDA